MPLDAEIQKAILSLLNHAPNESKSSDVTGNNFLHFLVPFNVIEHMVNNPYK